MKYALAILLAVAAQASVVTYLPGNTSGPSTCAPNTVTDSIAIPTGCSNLFYHITAQPGSGEVAFNDNPPSQGILPNGGYGDGDFNDLILLVQIEPDPFPDAPPGLETVFLSYISWFSASHDSATLGALTIDSTLAGDGAFFAESVPYGTTLDFILHTPQGSYDTLNLPPGITDTWEQFAVTSTPGEVPEPTSFLLLACAWITFALAFRKRRA